VTTKVGREDGQETTETQKNYLI